MTIRPNIQAWSYSHNPASSDRDAVRFYVGDINKDDKLLDDNEIDFVLAQEGTALQAAITCLQNLIVLYSRYVDSSGDKRTRAYSQRVESFRTSLDSLLERQAMGALNVFAGGISKSQKEAQCADTDRVPPVFTKQMFDNPRAARPEPDSGQGD